MPKKPVRAPSKKHPLVVAIGASTGSTEALKVFLRKLGEAENLSLILIQHADRHTGTLPNADWSRATLLKTAEIKNGTHFQAGVLYVAPAGALVNADGDAFALEPLENNADPASVIDHAFAAIAGEYKTRSVGLIFSGEGSDGSQGVRSISDVGGMTMAQTPESAERPSMPQHAIATGVVDTVATAEQMAEELLNYASHLEKQQRNDRDNHLQDQIIAAVPEICDILHKITRHDFKHYKTSTLVRRIQRRMQVLRLDNVGAYVDKINVDAKEADNLFKELLINVTWFFRDPEAFEALKTDVLVKALKERKSDQKYRIWVPGCSTGEEVYTLAILVREVIAKMPHPPEIQIIATDIDEVALNQARKGNFPVTIAEHVSPQRLKKFFIRKSGRYHVTKELREIVLFSSHNLINDPPFSQLDLISCRNVLIYLGSHLQKKLIPVFHYALRPGGHLFLGTSETLTGHKDLFRPISAKHRIAQRKATAIRPPGFATSLTGTFTPNVLENNHNHEADVHLISQRIILDEFAPKYAVVNEDGQIISVSAGIAHYLEPTEGIFQNNILKLVKPGLRVGLRSVFAEAKKHKRKITHEDSSLKEGDTFTRTGITVQPMPQLGDEAPLYMVVFHYFGTLTKSEKRKVPQVTAVADTLVVEQLERELEALREDLDRSVQDLEASNEELKSSNEELLSMNEELQSANEELETSKEEVQNANDALQRNNSDLENLMASTQIATLFLDDDLNIRNFTPQLQSVYNLARSDIGRPINHFTHQARFMPPIPSPQVVGFEEDTIVEDDVAMLDGRWLLRRISPYRTAHGAFNGIVVTFVDVTILRSAEERYRHLADSMPQVVWTADPSGIADYFNERWYEITGYSREYRAADGWSSLVHPEDLERATAAWNHSVRTGEPFQIDYRFRDARTQKYRWFLARAVPIRNGEGAVAKWYGSMVDINDLVVAKELQMESEKRFQIMANNAPVLVWMSDVDGLCNWFNKGWLDWTGRTLEEQLGNKWAEGVHPDDLERCLKIYTDNFNMQKEFYMEYRLRHHSGQYRWIGDRGIPRLTPDGRFEGYIGGCMDVHEQKIAQEKLQTNEARLNMMFDTSPSFMAMLQGPDFVFEQANERYLRLVHHRKVIGKPLREALPEVEAQGFIDLLHEVRDTGVPHRGTEVPVQLQGSNGKGLETRYLDFVYQPDRSSSGKIDRILVHGTDVTEKVLARHAIESAKNAIENERENFRNLFRQTPEMVCILKGPEHVFEFVNEAHIRVLGFDATGKAVRVAQPESVEVHGILDDVYKTGITAELHEIPVTLGDRLRYFNLTYSARRDIEGKVNGIMIIGVEITDQVLSRESIASQKKALEYTLRGAPVPEVLEVLTRMVEIQLGNGVIAAAMLLDKDGKRLHFGSGPSLPASYKAAFDGVEVGPQSACCGAAALYSETITVSDIANDPLWHNHRDIALAHGLRACWSTPIFSSQGKVLGTFDLYYREAHVPVMREQHLLDLVTRTAALVIERRMALEELRNAKNEAESANESKTRFLANMSHEIRTPLAAILGFTELLHGQLKSSDPEASTQLDRISRNASQLGRLIDDLLDLSKIEAERFEIERRDFDLNSAIEDVQATVNLKARDKGLKLEHTFVGEVPRYINSDPTRFRQVLTNVIGNAVKFTEKGSVRVDFERKEVDKKDMLFIRIQDTGIGLSPEHQRRIFDRFVQGDASVTRKYGGTGLGLILSRRLAQLMGGDLVLEKSVLGEGSTFLISIELGALTNGSAPVLDNDFAFDAKNALRGKTILAVDDAKDNQTIIRLFIEGAGGKVEIASNGLEAVETMKKKNYDVVLMDIQMPVMDGYQALMVSRENGYRGPIVALTAHALKEEKEACLAAGFSYYMSKPIDRALLIRRLAEITSSKQT